MIGTAYQAIDYFNQYLAFPNNDRKQLFDYDVHREIRSRNANNYFYELIGKIAEYESVSTTEVHDEILSHHMRLYRDADGNPEWITSNKEPNDYGFIKIKNADGVNFDYYYTDFDEPLNLTKENGKPFIDKNGNTIELKGRLFWRIKGTRHMNSLEMSQVINEVVQDAKSCGIPTKEDKEIERLLKQWEKTHG